MPESKKLYRGRCAGGPLDGEEGISRFPKGFLVVNRPAKQVAIYDYAEALGVFEVRLDANGNWRLLEIFAGRVRAAMESTYDVVAYDPEEMRPWDQ